MIPVSTLFEVNEFTQSSQQNKIKQDIMKIVPRSVASKIFKEMNTVSLKQAKTWPGYKSSDKFYLYPFKNKLEHNKFYRIGGFISCSDGHTSDVVCLYYPKTKKFEIEADGVNG
jgi:hypothetical protein